MIQIKLNTSFVIYHKSLLCHILSCVFIFVFSPALLTFFFFVLKICNYSLENWTLPLAYLLHLFPSTNAPFTRMLTIMTVCIIKKILYI